MVRGAAHTGRRLVRVAPVFLVLAGALACPTAPPSAGPPSHAASRVPAATPAGAVELPFIGAMSGVVQEVAVETAAGDEKRRRVLRVGHEVVPLPLGAAAVRNSGIAVAGVRDVHVVLVRPRGVVRDRSLTRAAAVAAVNRAAAYWRSQTGGAVRFRVAAVHRPYDSRLGCRAGVDRLWTEAQSRLKIRRTERAHLMLFAPRGARKGCGYGLGTMGSGDPLGLTFVTETSQSLVAHELGHNLGLDHAGALHCRGVTDPRYRRGWPKACRREEYGDLLDVMGYSGRAFGEGSLNAVNLDRLGLLPEAVRRIEDPGTYRVRISPLSAAPSARRAVRIVERSGQAYYVEYRTATGRDRAAGRNPFRPALGVRVLRQNPVQGSAGSLVLDATPSRRDDDYANSLAVGRRFTSASGQLTIRVVAANRAAATLLITSRAN